MKKIIKKKNTSSTTQATNAKNVDVLKWHTFESVLTKASKTKTFTNLYNEEVARLALAKEIRTLRALHNLTQKSVAERAGMPQSVIARIESGEHSISVDTLSKVATVFGKKVELV